MKMKLRRDGAKDGAELEGNIDGDTDGHTGQRRCVYVKEMASHISIFIKTTDNLNVSCGKIRQ